MLQPSSTNKPKTPGWQTRLLETVEGLKETPFAWGQNDCCIFAAKCLDAQYDTHIADGVVGQYETELGCKKFMIRRSGSTDLNAVLSTFLTNRIHKNFAQRGDLVVFDGDFGPTAGILWSGAIWAMGPDGVATLRVQDVNITDVWRV